MSYTINLNTKVARKHTALTDGEYTATIKAFVQSADSNPYIIFDVNGERDVRFYINNDVAVEIITSNINTQLDIDVNDDTDFFSWFNSVQGSQVDVWLMTTTAPDGKAYQNLYLYKPAGFDASVNGAI